VGVTKKRQRHATLTGEVNGQIQTFHFDEQQVRGTDSRGTAGRLHQPAAPYGNTQDRLPPEQNRLSGPDQETIDQYVKLSIRYGIVTLIPP